MGRHTGLSLITINIGVGEESAEQILARIGAVDIRLGEIMATLDEVKQAIADEAAQVQAGVAELKTQIQALKDQIANGQIVSAEDLDQLRVAVENIFTPEAPTPEEPAPVG